MQTQTVVFIIVAAIFAIGIVLFQYFFGTKRKGKLFVLLSFFRFLAIFGLLLLLINPKFSKNEYTVEKTSLLVVSDNSSSIVPYAQELQNIKEKLIFNASLSSRFNVQNYSFGSELNITDSLRFAEKSTNISKSLASINEIYTGTNTAVVLLTDGNQTYGDNYGFSSKNLKFPVYPIAIGDTVQYEDIKVSQINANTYAFLKNKFPVEATIVYDGTNKINTTVIISNNGKNVYRENIFLSRTESSKTIKTLLNASSVGIKSIQVRVIPLNDEKNVVNNTKRTAVEVIDEKTNITIVSDIMHPDIGALKKAIESNEQRSVSIKKPSAPIKEFEETDIFIIYQPNPVFKSIYQFIEQKKSNTFTVAGPKTDWEFLNIVQNSLEVNSYNQEEEVFPVVNQGFGSFDVNTFSTQDFPPLTSDLGEITITTSHEILLNQQIKGTQLNEPLLAVINENDTKSAILFGENLWKWRIQSFRNATNFSNFDDFFGKLMLYLSQNDTKDRLNINYQPIYQGNTDAVITATFFDEAFIFDAKASMAISLKNDSIRKEILMLLKGNFYEADLSSLPDGDYSFTVAVKDKNYSKSGSFTIEAFDMEQQFTSTDYTTLDRLTKNTEGKLFFPSQVDSLIALLNTRNEFVPTQKSTENIVSLIDFRILLAVIVFALSAEWFIRKYNGLI
ncbi:VWA domain-containing protein [Costertonia aggregata]|uniref:VWA domain-containing protein n=1 Tax=Costertonia aggregata TaxID=343403 RepID=A0A7H9AUI2_9FLAO|nr:VWA domain-containing protein [Costertonia aggregata]QLG47057.1 VWA domain-containing protein [Costertonia aggregata]